MILIKKRILGKATGHNDHYMINMGGQRSKIGKNWPLTGSYLQRCLLMVTYAYMATYS